MGLRVYAQAIGAGNVVHALLVLAVLEPALDDLHALQAGRVWIRNSPGQECGLAIIACLLILIYTGRQPTKRTYEMICFYLLGWASLAELEAHLQKLKLQ